MAPIKPKGVTKKKPIYTRRSPRLASVDPHKIPIKEEEDIPSGDESMAESEGNAVHETKGILRASEGDYRLIDFGNEIKVLNIRDEKSFHEQNYTIPEGGTDKELLPKKHSAEFKKLLEEGDTFQQNVSMRLSEPFKGKRQIFLIKYPNLAYELRVAKSIVKGKMGTAAIDAAMKNTSKVPPQKSNEKPNKKKDKINEAIKTPPLPEPFEEEDDVETTDNDDSSGSGSDASDSSGSGSDASNTSSDCDTDDASSVSSVESNHSDKPEQRPRRSVETTGSRKPKQDIYGKSVSSRATKSPRYTIVARHIPRNQFEVKDRLLSDDTRCYIEDTKGNFIGITQGEINKNPTKYKDCDKKFGLHPEPDRFTMSYFNLKKKKYGLQLGHYEVKGVITNEKETAKNITFTTTVFLTLKESERQEFLKSNRKKAGYKYDGPIRCSASQFKGAGGKEADLEPFLKKTVTGERYLIREKLKHEKQVYERSPTPYKASPCALSARELKVDRRERAVERREQELQERLQSLKIGTRRSQGR